MSSADRLASKPVPHPSPRIAESNTPVAAYSAEGGQVPNGDFTERWSRSISFTFLYSRYKKRYTVKVLVGQWFHHSHQCVGSRDKR